MNHDEKAWYHNRQMFGTVLATAVITHTTDVAHDTGFTIPGNKTVAGKAFWLQASLCLGGTEGTQTAQPETHCQREREMKNRGRRLVSTVVA